MSDTADTAAAPVVPATASIDRRALLASMMTDPRVSEIVGAVRALPELPRPTPVYMIVRVYDYTLGLLTAARADGTLDVVLAECGTAPLLDRIREVRTQLAVARLAPEPITPPVTVRVPTPLADRNETIARHIIDRLAAGDTPAAITVRSIAAATGISSTRVGESPEWEAFKARRKEVQTADASTRAQMLTGALLASMPDRAADDPVELAAERELEAMSDDERAAALARLEAEQADDLKKERRGRRD